MATALLGEVLTKLKRGGGDGPLIECGRWWDMSAPAIVEAAKAFSDTALETCAKIAAAKEKPTWDSVCALKTQLDLQFHVLDSILTFPQHVSTNEEVRKAAREADKILSDLRVDISSRHDVYLAFQAFEDTKQELHGEEKRYLDRTLRDYRRVGLHLDEETRNKVKEINKRCATLGIQLSENLSEDKTKLYFTKDQLQGMPDDFLSGLNNDSEGKFELTLKYPHYRPVMRLCQVPDTRKRMENAFTSRCIDTNTPIIEELVRLRHEKAQLLGYKTHAHFITEERMAKTPETVVEFLKDLGNRLTPLQDKELETIKALKREQESIAASDDVALNPWDISFYLNKVEKEQFQVDHQKIKEYFPLDTVTKGLMAIYEDVLSLRIEETAALEKWHDEDMTFKVSDKESGKLLGYFHLDLHPREGKYSHAACWGLQPSCATADGGRLVPVAALLCNFSRPTDSAPALLLHDEVETFFHEFGHGMHQLCSLAQLAIFAGTKVERDFVELPSQMLENWVWEKDALLRMSAHYQTGEKLPDELISALIKSRVANAGILTKRQILYATFDQTIHSQPEVNTAELFAELCTEICRYPASPNTNFAASFGHLAGGYDAQYYGYLWSEVFSADVYETRFKGHIFDTAIGREYREKWKQASQQAKKKNKK
ncbi:Thop1 protein [Salpingoeca rosetta]|uniref:Thop1 protein n=1 Tax=Salpingoeca rosetta (strain ATCC 50818 / BSB-021) TaxID=946362 RepID=F2UG91_SALR5|nr:Thop1 protein [Salpingoeca rosetta]EGD75641.1 Thop1 protein [Salpingoeca rosetta]|eukprot:XP_004991562.1 Thop1 protein [Salpingoeca rosetta]